jgi:hypothetical protein
MSEERPKSTEGLEPKLNKGKSPPAEEDLPEDVKQHNREMDKKPEQPADKLGDDQSKKDDKVGKEFWYAFS